MANAEKKNMNSRKKGENYLVKSVSNCHGEICVKTMKHINQLKLLFSSVYPKINILCSSECHNKVTFV